MPLAKPREGESQDGFIERCMSDDAMKEEFADDDQRLAVCYARWNEKKEKKSIEHRSFPVELRTSEDQKIVGHAAVFNKWSEDLGGFRERILPGAFVKALEKSDVRALWNHDANIVLGRTKSGTLTLNEDGKGLNVEIEPPSWATGYVETIQRGDVTEMSFAFTVAEEEWNETKKERSIKAFDELYDVSPVTYPAYPQTSVKVRMDESDKAEIIDGIGRYFKPADESDGQGAVPDGEGRVDSLVHEGREIELAGL